jgi:hypothetical protein
MLRFELGLLVLFLVGCQSEIDKCVDSEMKAWDSQQQKIQNDWKAYQSNIKQQEKNPNGGKDLSLELGFVKKPDERTRLEVEADERKSCMHIASGK